MLGCLPTSRTCGHNWFGGKLYGFTVSIAESVLARSAMFTREPLTQTAMRVGSC